MKIDTVRAWKDEAYRQSLSEEQLSLLPANPVGELELTDTDLLSISGSGGEFLDGFGCNFLNENEFVNSHALICQNSVFSNNNTRNSANSLVNVSDICINVA